MSNERELEQVLQMLKHLGIKEYIVEPAKLLNNQLQTSDTYNNHIHDEIYLNLIKMINFFSDQIASLGHKEKNYSLKYLNDILSIMSNYEHLFEIGDIESESSESRIKFSIDYLIQLINLIPLNSTKEFQLILKEGIIYFLTIHQLFNESGFKLHHLIHIILTSYISYIIHSISSDTLENSKSFNLGQHQFFNQAYIHLSESYINAIEKIDFDQFEINAIRKELLPSAFEIFSDIVKETMVGETEPNLLVTLYSIYLKFSFQCNNCTNSLLFNICIDVILNILNTFTFPDHYVYHSLLSFTSYLKFVLQEGLSFSTHIEINHYISNQIHKNLEAWFIFLENHDTHYQQQVFKLCPNLEAILLHANFTKFSKPIQKSYIQLSSLYLDIQRESHQINDQILTTLLELSFQKELLFVASEGFLKYYRIALKSVSSYERSSVELGRRDRSSFENCLDLSLKKFKSDSSRLPSPNLQDSPNRLFGHSDFDEIMDILHGLPNTFEFSLVSQLARLFQDFFIETQKKDFQLDNDYVFTLKRLIFACLIDQKPKSIIMESIQRLLDIYFRFVTKLYVTTMSKSSSNDESLQVIILNLYRQSIEIGERISIQNPPSKSLLLMVLIPFIDQINTKQFEDFCQSSIQSNLFKDFKLKESKKEIEKYYDQYCLLIEDFKGLSTLETFKISLPILCHHHWQNDQFLISSILLFILTNNCPPTVQSLWWKYFPIMLKQIPYKIDFLDFLTNQLVLNNTVEIDRMNVSSFIEGLQYIYCALEGTLTTDASNLDRIDGSGLEFKFCCTVCDKEYTESSPFRKNIKVDNIFELLQIIDFDLLNHDEKISYLKLIQNVSKHLNVTTLIENQRLHQSFLNAYNDTNSDLPLYISYHSEIIRPIFRYPELEKNDRFINKIYDILTNFIENESNSRALISYIKCTGLLIREVDYEQMLPLLILLLKAFIHADIHSSHVVCQQFKLLFITRNINNPFILIIQFLSDISDHLLEIFIRPEKIKQFANLFQTNTKDFVKNCLRDVLPIAIHKYTANEVQMILSYAKIDIETAWNLFGLHCIVYYIVEYQDHWISQFEQSLQQYSLKIEIENEVQFNLISIVNEIIFIGSKSIEHEKRVSVGLKSIYQILSGSANESSKTTDEELSKFLQPLFLNYLNFSYEFCQNPNHLISKKFQILKTLKKLMYFLNNDIAPYFYQICSFFAELCKFEHLQLPIIQIMEPLPTLLNDQIFGIFLNHYISIIFTHLNQFVNPELQSKLIQTVDKIIIGKSSILKDFLKWFPILPDCSEFENINRHLPQFLIDKNPHDLINYYVDLINQNALMSCETGLNGLSNYLNNNEDFVKTCLNQTPVPMFVNNLYIALFNVFHDDREATESNKMLAAQILGRLGATDLDLLINNEKNIELPVVLNRSNSESWVKFCQRLIHEILIPKFQLSPSFQNQIKYAYAIQEMIKSCGFKQLLDNSSTTNIGFSENNLAVQWNDFTQYHRVILNAMLKSNFVIKNPPKITHSPIDSHCDSFEQWLSGWCLSLIQQLDHNVALPMFKSLIGIIQLPDIQLISLIFPHLIFHCLKSSNTSLNLIIEEIQSIFNNANLHQHKDSPFYLKYHKSLKFILKLLSSLEKIINTLEEFSIAKKQSSFLSTIERLKEITRCVSKKEMGRASMKVNDLASSIRSLEYYYRELGELGTTESYQVLDELEEAFCKNNDRDSVIGISALLGKKSDELQLKDYLYMEDWSSAQSWYQAALHKDSSNSDYKLGLVNAYRHQGLHLVVESLCDNFLSTEIPQQVKIELQDCALEASWKSSNLPRLEIHILQDSNHTFNYSLGKLMILMNGQSFEEAIDLIELTRKNLIPQMGFTGGNFFQGLQESLTHLHMLDNFEFLIKNSSQTDFSLKSLTEYWQAKLEHMPVTFKHRENILSLSRSLLQLIHSMNSRFSDSSILDDLWIKSVKLARHAGYNSTAQAMMAYVSQEKLWEVHIQNAKNARDHGDLEKGLNILNTALTNKIVPIPTQEELIRVYNPTPSHTSNQLHVDHPYYPWTKLSLLYNRWMHEISGASLKDLKRQFENIHYMFPNFHKAAYNLSQFCIDMAHEFMLHKHQSIQELIHATSTSITYSTTALSQYPQYTQLILPRVINLITEFTNHFSTPQAKGILSKHGLQGKFVQVFRDLKTMTDVLHARNLFYVFNQVSSGICHESDELSECFIHLSRKVLYNYPYQSFWNLAPMILVDDKAREKRAKKLIRATYSSSPNLVDQEAKDIKFIFEQYHKLWNFLYKLSISQASITEFMNFSASSLGPFDVIIPIESTMTQPDLTGFEPKFRLIDKKNVVVMRSMAKPIRFTILGTDNTSYKFLCKPHDDLRKDARVMEFNNMLNRLLNLETDSKKRSLKIKTYSVVPINSKCGIIEWVENTLTAKAIISEYYKKMGVFIDYAAMMSRLKPMNQDQKYTYFVGTCLKKYPPVLHKWYYDIFSDPKRWYRARLTYSRSLAVMSMVGYILGLGDRHSENVMFDQTSGSILHIDFNCLFESGKNLMEPEVVPFRLTHNFVDCLGPAKIEGNFRISCEITLKICRKYHKTLFSVLQSFMTDPLVEWGQVKHSIISSDAKKLLIQNKATEILDLIQRKLKGTDTSPNPILVRQQVNALIEQATDNRRLCVMYIGWAPFL